MILSNQIKQKGNKKMNQVPAKMPKGFIQLHALCMDDKVPTDSPDNRYYAGDYRTININQIICIRSIKPVGTKIITAAGTYFEVIESYDTVLSMMAEVC